MITDVIASLKKFDIRPAKSLGQNFLTDVSIIRRIVDVAGIKSSDAVLEIGPGLGNMTAELASRAGMVVAVEIDKRLIPVLKDNLKDFENVHILNRDIMKFDICSDMPGLTHMQDYTDWAGIGFKPAPFKIVANLPYYITTPIIMGLLEKNISDSVDLMVFMVQSEVADRIVARPGGKEYGALSVAVQYFSQPARIFDVPPQCFVPQPGVVSTVVRFDVRKAPPVSLLDKELFFKTVRASFGQRRKMLVNALYNSGYFSIGKEDIKEILRNIGIGEHQRGETLSIMQFAELANCISKYSLLKN